MKVLVTVFRVVSIIAGLLGVAIGAIVLLAVGLASMRSGDSGAGMVAYGLMVLATPIAAVLTGAGLIGVLLTRRVAHQ